MMCWKFLLKERINKPEIKTSQINKKREPIYIVTQTHTKHRYIICSYIYANIAKSDSRLLLNCNLNIFFWILLMTCFVVKSKNNISYICVGSVFDSLWNHHYVLLSTTC